MTTSNSNGANGPWQSLATLTQGYARENPLFNQRFYPRLLSLLSRYVTTLLSSFPKPWPNNSEVVRKACDEVRRTLGSKHEYTLLLQGALGFVLYLKGDMEQAVQTLEETLTEWENMNASQRAQWSPNIYDCKVDLACASSHLGHPAKVQMADRYFWEAYDGFRASLGAAHPCTLYTAHMFAEHLLRKTFSTEVAQTLIQNTIATRRSVHALQNSDMYVDIYLLARCEAQNKNLEEAEKHYKEALSYFTRTPGSDPMHIDLCRAGLLDLTNPRRYVRPLPPTTTYYRPLQSSGQEALSRRVATFLGHSTLPRMVLSKGLGPPAQGPYSVQDEIIMHSVSPDVCTRCKSITLDGLLKGKSNATTDPAGKLNISYPPEYLPIILEYENPALSAQTCRMCKIILGHLATSTSPRHLELSPRMSELGEEKIDFVDVVLSETGRRYQNSLCMLTEPSMSL
jgi:tetratricopeptide (TPR) repeat protein